MVIVLVIVPVLVRVEVIVGDCDGAAFSPSLPFSGLAELVSLPFSGCAELLSLPCSGETLWFKSGVGTTLVVTGQTVVDTVTTCVTAVGVRSEAGQSGTEEGQAVMVETTVERIVEVVYSVVLDEGSGAAELSASLDSAGFVSSCLASAELDSAGLDSAGLDSAGLDSAGFAVSVEEAGGGGSSCEAELRILGTSETGQTVVVRIFLTVTMVGVPLTVLVLSLLVYSVRVVEGPAEGEAVGAEEAAPAIFVVMVLERVIPFSPMGHTVVLIATEMVVTTGVPLLTGQFFTVGAHEVMVLTCVE